MYPNSKHRLDTGKRYIYGVTSEGSREFLMTSLDLKGAKDYLTKHKNIFVGRYKKYIVYNMPFTEIGYEEKVF